jgi:exonuclease III
MEENTFHGFRGRGYSVNGDQSAWRLDWILARSGARSVSVKSCAIVRQAVPPLYPSDHYPVVADLQID